MQNWLCLQDSNFSFGTTPLQVEERIAKYIRLKLAWVACLQVLAKHTKSLSARVRPVMVVMASAQKDLR